MNTGTITKLAFKETISEQDFDLYCFSYIAKGVIRISEDQNTMYANYLKLNFCPVKKVKKTHCHHCWLLRGVTGFECDGVTIPCRAENRKDKRNGVFSIRQMPETGGEE